MNGLMTTQGKKELLEEEAIARGVMKALVKARREKKKEYRDKATALGLPFCNSCFKRDYPEFLHANFKFYTEMKAVKDNPWRERDQRNPNYGKVTGIHRDYECTHTYTENRIEKKCPGKTSIWIPIDELPEDYLKKKKVTK